MRMKQRKQLPDEREQSIKGRKRAIGRMWR
jgi:hypothetical protein